MLVSDWSRYPNFTRSEMSCNHCGRADMEQDFMDTLQALRTHFGRPLIVSSGYRCPVHNNAVSSSGLDGPHTTGKAADIVIERTVAFNLIKLALTYPFTGIGIDQKGISRFIHLDMLDQLEASARNTIRPTIWSY